MKEEKLWSIWQRSRMAAKHSEFWGKDQTKDATGKVVASFIWIGRLCIGWYVPLNVAQAAIAVDHMNDMKAPTDSLTQGYGVKNDGKKL